MLTEHTIAIPEYEILDRQARCLEQLSAAHPDAGGLMVFSRVNIYYLTGTMANGLLWLPREGKALLMVRKGLERARTESPYSTIAEYRSFSDIKKLCAEFEVPLTPEIAAEMAGLPWSLAANLQQRLPEVHFRNCGDLISIARSHKTAWEMERMRRAGQGHAAAMEHILPSRLQHSMTEMAIAKLVFDIYYEQGSCGMSRLSGLADELLTGFVSVGENGNFPSFYNGPLGCHGIHPAAPFWGSPHAVWSPGNILVVDMDFCFEGYNTDKTSCYFSGKERDIPVPIRTAFQVCKNIEEECASMLKPGAVPAEIYRTALARAEKAGYAGNFMGLNKNQVPFLGHGIGLCVDEWPVLANRFFQPLEAGMTIAIEPKVGLPEYGMVGTENTWEVTEAGGRSLTGKIHDIICVE